MIDSTPEQWKQQWARKPAWRAIELAWLCCGWEPKSKIDMNADDRGRFDRAVNEILLAVQVKDPSLPIIEDLRWPPSDAEHFYREAPLFRPSAVWKWAKNYSPTFPFSAEDFEPQTGDGEELDTREQTTLLTMIAALANQLKIDFTEPSKAASVLAAFVRELRVKPIAERTIATHLTRIPDALDRRRPEAL